MVTPIFASPFANPIDVTPSEAYEHILDVTDDFQGIDISLYDIHDFCWFVCDVCEITGQYSSTLFARILHETDYLRFTGDVDPEQYNLGGLGAIGNGVKGLSFPNLLAGVLAVALHEIAYYGDLPEEVVQMIDPRYAGAWGRKDKTRNIEDFGNGVWGADPDYAPKMLRIYNRLKGTQQEDPTNSDLFVMIAAGHHNAQGGNPVEYDIVDDITEYVYLALQRHGVKLVSLTPDGPDEDTVPGDGDSPYRIYEMWQKGIQEHGVPDLAFEVHTEGVANTDVNGCFVIYPDWDGDMDADVAAVLGPSIVDNIVETQLVDKRGNGLMSEKATGVGSQGHRLGFFSATSTHRATSSRFIVECGAHSNFGDLEVLKVPAHQEEIAEAIVRACVEFYGIDWVPPGGEPDPEEPVYVAPNGFTVKAGFLNRYLDLRAVDQADLKHVGYPLTNEFVVHLPALDEDGTVYGKLRAAQIFEKDVWTYNPDADPNGWEIQSALQPERDYITAYAELLGLY